MNTEKKALFFDVDGTLLDDAGHVPESAVDAIRAARKRGHLIFVNSGRVKPLAEYINRFIETDGLLCGCGTEILLGEKSIYTYILPPDVVEELKKDSGNCRVDMWLEGPEGIAFSPELRVRWSGEVEQNVLNQGGMAAEGFQALSKVSKFCMQGNESSDYQAMLKKYGRWFHMMDQSGGFYECVPQGHDKAKALLRTLEYCGIPLENAYAFGDSVNDLEMLRAVPHAVVMGAHAPELEYYGSFITKKLEDDGIAYAMQELGLI
ncbi:MAG: HAD family hydrolase [Eubacteriales bacterium]|nr:HAD family hydrolase [Eubacteriales bacterium]